VQADAERAQTVALYRLLNELAPGPMVTLNQAAAAAMMDGPQAGLALLEPLHDRLRGHRTPLHAVRAYLLETAGDHAAAAAEYRLPRA